VSRSWAVIDLAAVAHNVRLLRAVAGAAALCAVVKADGYGHGAEPVARAALAAGARHLAVAQVSEGIALRQAGIDARIWVLGEPEPDEFAEARRHRLEPAVYSPRGIDAAAATSGTGRWPVHLKLDTGMGRVGARPDGALGLARRVVSADGLALGSVFTHLAVADEPERPETDAQLACLDAALAALAAGGIEPPLVHAANTAGALAHPASRRDVVRCGIGLYGIAPGPGVEALAADLRPVMTLHTRVGFAKRVPAGTAVGYGLRRAVATETTLASLPVGYADGYRRVRWDRGAAVLIGGVRRPVVGVVSMDQVVVDCGDDPVRSGDETVLLGRQGDEEVTVQEWAAQADTIGYEIVCGIGPRVERRYVGGDA
jgi:alanine racemase